MCLSKYIIYFPMIQQILQSNRIVSKISTGSLFLIKLFTLTREI